MYDIDVRMSMYASGGFPKCFEDMDIDNLKKAKEDLEKLIQDHQEKISEYQIYLKYVKGKLENPDFTSNKSRKDLRSLAEEQFTTN